MTFSIRNEMPSFFGVASSLLLLALCIASIVSTLYSVDLHHRARNWHSKQANVKILLISDDLNPEDSYSSEFCQLQYTFNVSNVMYNGSRANVWSHLATARFCDFLTVRRTMQPIVCWYDPSNPTHSILDRRLFPWNLSISIFVIATLAYIAIAILLFDGVFKLFPSWIVSAITLSTCIAVMLVCYRAQVLTNTIMSISIGFCAAVFWCTTISWWLFWDGTDRYESDWLHDETLGLLTVPGMF